MHFLSLALQLPLCPQKKTKEKKEKNSRKKKTFQRQAKHMQFFVFQMKQLLEQVKFKENDFEVSCLLGKNGCVCVHAHFCSWSQKCLWNLPIQCQNISSLSSGTSPVVCSYVLIVWMDTARAKNNGYKDFGRGTQCPFIGQSWSNWVLADSAKPNWNTEGAFLLTENSKIFVITW